MQDLDDHQHQQHPVDGDQQVINRVRPDGRQSICSADNANSAAIAAARQRQ